MCAASMWYLCDVTVMKHISCVIVYVCIGSTFIIKNNCSNEQHMSDLIAVRMYGMETYVLTDVL